MDQSCFSLRFLSQNSLWKLSLFCLHFVGIRVFIVGYEMECERSFFNKIRCIGKSLRDWDESQVLVTSYLTRPDCTFCPVVI